eukprot:10357895-Heterocapsa_arctica.AAC.1
MVEPARSDVVANTLRQQGHKVRDRDDPASPVGRSSPGQVRQWMHVQVEGKAGPPQEDVSRSLAWQDRALWR